MQRVQEESLKTGHLLGQQHQSVSPGRPDDGQFRVLEALRWKFPIGLLVPGGNLGNSSAFGKAFYETL